ncbi:MAG: DUF1449 family protein [Saprospiraceae bacterium]|nr:DUF1449 family protein [Saprospiraceae bacterium]
MQALLHEALLPVNIFFTILLVFVMLYWLTVLVGAIDLHSFNFNVDIDADVDADVDVDTDVDSHNGGSWLSGSLQFFNFGRIPFMIVFSFLTLCMWALSILYNYYWGQGSWGTAAILFFPNLALSLLTTKLITTPLIPVFKHFDGSEKAIDYIGQECTLTLPVSGTNLGQAEVLIDDNPLLVNVKSAEGNALKRGTKALIINEIEGGKYFEIRALID